MLAHKRSDNARPASRKALGRGLGALIPAKEGATSMGVSLVAIDRIVPNPYQPRRQFRDQSLDELASSIREHGVIQPLIVSRDGDRFRLVAGERRLRAAKKAGLDKVPIVVRDHVVGDEGLALALIENIQREDLNPIEEALAYQQLHDEFGLTQEEISKRVGRERSTVANTLRLLRLPDDVQAMVAGGDLTMGHARCLLALATAGEQRRLAARIVKAGLSVRQVEMLVSDDAPPKRARIEKAKDVFTRDAEEKLTAAMRTKVEIHRARRGGAIRIRFSSEDELIRIYEHLTRRRK